MRNRILRIRTVQDVTGISRSSIYVKISQGEFPKPISLGSRSVGWLESDIQAWIDYRISQSDSANQYCQS